jgi:tetratricopeptide (TPR) repeat protein
MSDLAPPVPLEEQSATLTATLFNKLPPVLARALQLTAIPYWFDLRLLTVLRDSGDGDGRTQKVLDWLSERSFVARLPRDRYVLNTDVRGLIRARWTLDRAGFAEANRRLADYFAAQLATASGPEADELRQAYIYHLLGADSGAGIVELQKAFAEAEFSHRLAVAERLVEVAAEQRQFLEPGDAAWIDYLEARSLQLHNRWEPSRERLQSLSEQADLPSELRPRVQAALAASLVETQHWTQAIELYQQARTAFEAHGLYDEVATCQLGLGYAHMNLGLNVWGQRESRPAPPPSIRQTLADLATLPVRLPILLYVLFSARQVELFPAWLTLARGVDWTIARLFVQASRWYHLALAHMEAAHNTDGILRAKDSLARLYLALGYPAGAVGIYRELIARTDVATSEYQMARARAGLGVSLLGTGRLAEAVESLKAAAPVLADYGDSTFAGRAFSFLAEAQVVTGAADDAIASYSTALELMRTGDDLTRATDVAHSLEAIAARDELPQLVRERAGQLAASVVQRCYPTRYRHPALEVFRQISVAALAVILFITLYFATRTETVIEIGAGTTLIAQALTEPSSSVSPVISPSRAWQVAPQFRANVAMGGVLVGLIGYLVAYTAVGLYVLMRTSLSQLEEGQSQDVQFDPDALARGAERIPWAEATGLLRNDWTIRERTLPYGQTVLFGGRGHSIAATGYTAWYRALADEMARRIPPTAQQVDLSTSLTNSPSGILLIGNAIYLVLFVAMGYLAPDWLNVPIFFGHYALADLRIVIYLGLLIPLISWLVITPMRRQLFFNPRRVMPWGVVGAGLGLACLSFINLGLFHFSLGRPDVIVSLLAVWLVWLGATAIYRSRWQPVLRPESAGLPAYPAMVRWCGLIVAVVISLMAVPLVVRELLGYDALLAGNVARERATVLASRNDPKSQARYTEALADYARALSYNPRDVAALTGRGAIYSQNGEWGKAINSYTTSLAINTRQPTVWSNLGLAYEGQASALDNQVAILNNAASQHVVQWQEEQTFHDAINAYTRAFELDRRNAKYVLRRGVVKSTLGQLLLDEGRQIEARTIYSSALEDFSQSLRLEPDNADAYNGSGWAHFKIAESYYDSVNKAYVDKAAAQAEYEKARDSFLSAVRLDPQNANAQNGLAWTWLKLGDIQRSQGDSNAAQSSYEQALQAYANASRLAPNDPQYAVSVGNARWLVSTNLVTCRNPAATDAELTRYVGMIEDAIADVDRGTELARAQKLTLDKGVAYYYRELGQLAFILSSCKGQDPISRLEQAVAYYDKAIVAEPTNVDYFQMRGRLTYALSLRRPNDATGKLLRVQDLQVALSYLSFSLALAPDNHDTLNWRAVVNLALSDTESKDTTEGLARRSKFMSDAVADRLRMLALAQDDVTRRNDAMLLAAAYLRLGWNDYVQGKYQQAADEAADAIKYDPGNPVLYFNQGLAELAMGDEEQALRTYDAGIAVAKQLSDDVRKAKLDEGIGDLQNLVKQRPELATVAEPILKALQAAR